MPYDNLFFSAEKPGVCVRRPFSRHATNAKLPMRNAHLNPCSARKKLDRKHTQQFTVGKPVWCHTTRQNENERNSILRTQFRIQLREDPLLLPVRLQHANHIAHLDPRPALSILPPLADAPAGGREVRSIRDAADGIVPTSAGHDAIGLDGGVEFRGDGEARHLACIRLLIKPAISLLLAEEVARTATAEGHVEGGVGVLVLLRFGRFGLGFFLGGFFRRRFGVRGALA